MAALQRVDLVENVTQLVQVLRKDGQDSLPVQQMLLRYAECKEKIPELDTRLYLPAGKVDMTFGTFFLYIPTHRENVVLHTMDKDIDRVVSQIRSIEGVNWSGGLCLGPIHDKFDPIINLLMEQENLENLRPNPCYNMAMTREAALLINPQVPEGYELRKLRADDAEFVNDRWPHKEHHTLAYLRDALVISDGLALCHKGTGERVSWCMHSLVGGVGMIKTAEQHGGRGFGTVVGAAMTLQIAQAGYDPQPRQMLEMHAECSRVLPSIDMRLYIPAGKVDQYGTFLLYIPEHRGCIVFHTLCSDEELLLQRISEVDIDYEANAWFGPIHERFSSLIQKVGDGEILRPITLEDAEFVDSQWPHRDGNTLHYIRNIIRVKQGLALCSKESGEMLSWGLFCLVGGVGMIQTAGQHRGKGYGETVSRHLTSMVAEAGFDPQAQVNTDTPASYALFRKIGYKHTHTLQWHPLRRIK